MAVAIVHSRALAGVHAPVVTVEVHLAGGLPGVHLVGLPEAEVREARDQVTRYRGRVSGPLIDRLDLVIEVPPVSADALAFSRNACGAGEHSADVRARVERAYEHQRARQGKSNARLTVSEVTQHCRPEPAAETLLARAMTRMSLSARAYHRILKVARTIADLAGSATITTAHVAEAIQFRRFERAV
jgi:magnesium chelatase family protein